MDKAKPCKQCKNQPNIGRVGKIWYVECKNCHNAIDGFWRKKDAIEAWNEENDDEKG